MLPTNEPKVYLSLQNTMPEEKDLGIKYAFVYNIRVRKGIACYTVGYISLRVGESPALYYLGHVGYRVDKMHRGHGYAAKALELLKQKAYNINILSLAVTCDTDNIASRKTCLNAGCVLEQIAEVPLQYRELCMGSAKKCRYILFTEEEH